MVSISQKNIFYKNFHIKNLFPIMGISEGIVRVYVYNSNNKIKFRYATERNMDKQKDINNIVYVSLCTSRCVS